MSTPGKPILFRESFRSGMPGLAACWPVIQVVHQAVLQHCSEEAGFLEGGLEVVPAAPAAGAEHSAHP